MARSSEGLRLERSCRSQWLSWGILVVILAGICWVFPLFHLVPLEKARQQQAAGIFNPAQFAETFWSDKLMKSLDKAVKADVLLPAIQSDAAAAKKKYGHALGMSESYTYFVSGIGKVLAVNKKEVSLAVTEGATKPEIVLETGLLFGNAVRDGTGLLDVNDYPNSQDFNAIASELNRIVETRVLTKLREQAKVGMNIQFAGCAEVGDEAVDLRLLRVVPVKAEAQ